MDRLLMQSKNSIHIQCLSFSPRNKAIISSTPYKITLCEPCTLTIDVLVPYELELNQTRGLEAQIWTNVCDKYSSTGRWHAIPARRIEIRKELRGRVHSFSASFLPIRCGSFEFTARVRAPKFESSDWIWATQDAKNELIHVTRIGMNRPELTQGMVRQLAQWFDNLLICWHMHDRGQSRESDESNPSMKYSHHNLTAFVAAFLSVIALSNGTDLEASVAMSYVLCESTWLENRNNAIKVLSWCIGNCSLATSFMERIENYILPPITSESLKRIRMTMIDCEKDRFQVADSLFALITSNHSCIL